MDIAAYFRRRVLIPAGEEYIVRIALAAIHMNEARDFYPLFYNSDVRGKWWALRDSNPRHPRCKRGALPTELSARPDRTGHINMKSAETCQAAFLPPLPDKKRNKNSRFYTNRLFCYNACLK